MLIDVQCVARAGGMRILLQTLSEGPPALASLLSPVFLYIIDSPSTRKHFRPGKDLEVRIDGSGGPSTLKLVSRLRSPGLQMHMVKTQSINSVSRISVDLLSACCGLGVVCLSTN